MEEIFKTIFNAVKALTFVKEVAFDEGQLESVNEDGSPAPALQFPGVLIDVNQVQWEAGDIITQQGTASVIVRYAYRKTTAQSNTTSSALFAASITALKKRMDVEKAIATATPESSHGRLLRLSTERERRSDGIIVYRTMFVCSVAEAMV